MEDWVLYDYRESDAKRKPDEDKYIEIVFPSKIPAELLTNIFSFNQNKELPNWSFDKVYIRFNDHSHTLQVIIFSRSEEHTSELQSRGHLVCRLLLEKKNIYNS